MAWRSNKKGLAVVGLFLFLMGVVVPAAFGLLTEKAMGLGVGDLLDKSTNWDESNIANSTYFVAKTAEFHDADTATKYAVQYVYDEQSGLDLVMADTSSTDTATSSVTCDVLFYIVELNTTSFENVDKIVAVVKLEDKANIADLDKVHVKTYLYDGDVHKLQEFNATELVNNTLVVETEIDALTRLKLNNANHILFYIKVEALDNTTELNDSIWGFRVELYDVKKVNATAASNIMLAVSGVLGWLGALAATPYWNPYANREHRNVRRVGSAIRRRIPRRRR